VVATHAKKMPRRSANTRCGLATRDDHHRRMSQLSFLVEARAYQHTLPRLAEGALRPPPAVPRAFSLEHDGRTPTEVRPRATVDARAWSSPAPSNPQRTARWERGMIHTMRGHRLRVAFALSIQNQHRTRPLGSRTQRSGVSVVNILSPVPEGAAYTRDA
jgi:hypothetical protein